MLFASIILGATCILSKNPKLNTFNNYTLPYTIGKWTGTDVNCDKRKLMSILEASDIVFRKYVKDDISVTLYLAYYQDLSSSDFAHAPTVCYLGQGWNIKKNEFISRKIAGKIVTINRILVEKGEKKQLVYTWWQTKDKIFASHSKHRFYQLWKHLFASNSSAIWVRITIDGNGQKILSKEHIILSFCKDMAPLFKNYFKF